MAGCGTCPDQCSCVIVNQCNEQYPGAGSADAPIVVPERYDYPWVGASSDGSITIEPNDVRAEGDCSDPDGHAPDLRVNFCNVVDDGLPADGGDVLVLVDDDEECRPHRLRDPLPGEVLARNEDGQAGWVAGVASFGGDMPYGVVMEFWGSAAAVPDGYGLADGGLIPIADNPNLFATINFNASGGVDPGGGMFRKPDKRGMPSAGLDNMGGTPANRVTDPQADVIGGVVGVEAAALTVGNLPPHTHPLAITGAATGVSVNAGPSAVSIGGAGTGIAIVADGNHTHNGAGANHNFLVENGAPAVFNYLDITAQNVDTAGTMRFTSNGVEGGNSYKPNREPNTAFAGTHGHGVSDPTHTHSVTNGNHGHTISDPTHTHGGTANANANQLATPVSRMQPTTFCNFILRLG